jgi:peptidoglycan L-alanyl-D-glutamate endopeptidase CwlK
MSAFNPNKSSRKVEDLLPVVGHKAILHINACQLAGIELLITCTYRCPADQAALYAQGRTVPGRIVTKAKAGDSTHQYRVSYDVVPLRNGKPVWATNGNGIDNDPTDDDKDNLELWQRVGELGKSVGLEWAGDWKKFKEFPHFQYTGGLTLADLRAGRVPL